MEEEGLKQFKIDLNNKIVQALAQFSIYKDMELVDL